MTWQSQVVGAIDAETKENATLIEQLEISFADANAALRATIRKVNKKLAEGYFGGNHLLYLAIFALLFIFMIWVRIRGGGMLRFFNWRHPKESERARV